MRTKLALFCDKLIEAGWLTAVVVVPVLFSIYTNDRYAINKVSVVRSLALAMMLAWIVRTIEQWPAAEGRKQRGSFFQTALAFLHRPLVGQTLLFVSIVTASTALSIWPHGSLWGTYDRRQGTYTALSYVVVGVALLALLRSDGALERLAGLLVLGSAPVCLHALGQDLEILPEILVVRFGGGRAASSFGNPVFLSAYLVVVAPVTLRQLIRSFRRLIAARRNPLADLGPTVLYAAVLAMQLYVVFLTQSRGPFLALVVGLMYFVVLWALSAGRHLLGIGTIALAVLAGVILVGVNMSDPLSSQLRDLPYVGRLSNVAGEGVLEARTLIWQGAIDLSTANPARFLLGYGPEAMDMAFYGHYPVELVELSGPGKTADRSHNVVLDALVSTGLVGALIYLVLVGSVLMYGLRALGLVGDRRQRQVSVATLAGGGILGLVAAWIVGGARFAGLGVSAGLLAGLFLYAALFLIGALERQAEPGRHYLLVIALLSSMVAHFAEVQSGIPVTVTRLYFWVYAGVLASAVTAGDGVAEPVATLRPASEAATAKRPQDRASSEPGDADAVPTGPWLRPDLAPVVACGFAVGLLLIAVFASFVTHRSDLTGEPFAGLILLAVWLSAGLVVAGSGGEADPGREVVTWLERLLAYAVPSLLSLLLFAVPHLLIVRGFPAVSALPVVYYVATFVVLMAVALALARAEREPQRRWRRDRAGLYPILGLVVLGLVIITNLNLVRADVSFRLGRLYEQGDAWDQVVAHYERAVDLAPGQDRYFQFLGHAYLKKAQPGGPQRPYWFQQAENALRRAVQISPLNPFHRANLGNMYHAWADVTQPPQSRAERLTLALAHYREAVGLAPETHSRLLADAIFEAHLSLAEAYAELGRTGEAVEEARAARVAAPSGRRQEAERLIATLEAPEQ